MVYASTASRSICATPRCSSITCTGPAARCGRRPSNGYRRPRADLPGGGQPPGHRLRLGHAEEVRPGLTHSGQFPLGRRKSAHPGPGVGPGRRHVVASRSAVDPRRGGGLRPSRRSGGDPTAQGPGGGLARGPRRAVAGYLGHRRPAAGQLRAGHRRPPSTAWPPRPAGCISPRWTAACYAWAARGPTCREGPPRNWWPSIPASKRWTPIRRRCTARRRPRFRPGVSSASVTKSPLGYRLACDDEAVGLCYEAAGAVFRPGRAEHADEDRAGGEPPQRFLVLGDKPDEPALLKCGFRYAQKKAMIVKAPTGGRQNRQPTLRGRRGKDV